MEVNIWPEIIPPNEIYFLGNIGSICTVMNNRFCLASELKMPILHHLVTLIFTPSDKTCVLSLFFPRENILT